MSKQLNNQKSESENLPALPLDPVIEKELENTEGVLQLDDFTIKMTPREKGFMVSYDAGWEPMNELPPLILISSEIYWAQYNGTEYIKRSLDDPPPENEKDQWDKFGKLNVFHPKYGQGGFLLAPSGVLAFKGYLQKWKRQGINVFGAPIKVSSRVTKTQKGFVINVPKFLYAGTIESVKVPTNPVPPGFDQPDPPTQDHIDPPTLELSDYVLEPDDEIPF